MRRKATLITFLAIVVVAIAVDRLSKNWAQTSLRPGQASYDLGPISFTLVHNRGAAFGMGQGNTLLFVAIALVIIGIVLGWLFFAKEHRRIEVIALSLVVAGGIGNLIDRVTTVYVVDFIQFDFVDFPVFNVADICVTCGVVLFILAMFVTSSSRSRGSGRS